MHKVAKATWIKHLSSAQQCDWKTLFLKMMDIKETLLNKKLDRTFFEKCATSFHKQVLQSWTEYYGTKSSTNKEILNEYILYNKYIKMGRRTYSIDRFPNVFGYNVKIIDIVDENGHFLERSILNEKLGSNLSQMSYNSLISAIPKDWKAKIKEKPVILTDRLTDEIRVKCNNILLSLEKITAKKMYNEIIQELAKPPTAIEAWIEIYPFLETHDWKYTFNLPNIVAKETYLQSFQYKIITRTLNCNNNLYKWGIKASPTCIYCGHWDTIMHHLFECKESKIFWNHVQNWIFDKLKTMFRFTVCEIIFGIYESDDVTRVVNYIILYGKLYINKQRTNNKDLVLAEFIIKLKDKIKVLLTFDQASPLFKSLL